MKKIITVIAMTLMMIMTSSCTKEEEEEVCYDCDHIVAVEVTHTSTEYNQPVPTVRYYGYIDYRVGCSSVIERYEMKSVGFNFSTHYNIHDCFNH